MSSSSRRTPRSSGRAPAARRRPASRGAAPKKARPAPSRRAPRPGRRIAIGLAVSFVLVLVLLLGVFPTRQWLDQRDELRDRQAELARQQEEQEQLEQRIAVLQTEEEVERMARDEFGMVRPGEDPYRVLPPAVPPVDLPDAWPFAGADDWLNR